MAYETKIVSTDSTPITPRLYSEESSALRLSDADALNWAQSLREQVLTFDKEQSNYTLADPFERQEDRKYLLMLTEEGKLEPAIPLDRTDDPSLDAELCRRLATLSQEGRLFLREPAARKSQQLVSTFEGGTCSLTLSSRHKDFPVPEEREALPPVRPPFWKYLLYPFFAQDIQSYHQKKDFFENNRADIAKQNKAFYENLKDSVDSLTDMKGIDTNEEEYASQLGIRQFTQKQLRAERLEHLKEIGFRPETLKAYERIERDAIHSLKRVAHIPPIPEDPATIFALCAHADPEEPGPGPSYTDLVKNWQNHTETLAANPVDLENPNKLRRLALEAIEANFRHLSHLMPDDPEFHMYANLTQRIWDLGVKDYINTLDREGYEYSQLHKVQASVQGLTSMKELFSEVNRDKQELLDSFQSTTTSLTGQNRDRMYAGLILYETLRSTIALNKHDNEARGTEELSPAYGVLGLNGHESIITTLVESHSFQHLPQNTESLIRLMDNRQELRKAGQQLLQEWVGGNGYADRALSSALTDHIIPNESVDSEFLDPKKTAEPRLR